MRTVELSEAKRKLSLLLRRVKAGESIIITLRGERVALLAPPTEADVAEFVGSTDRVRGSLSKRRKISVKSLIEEGRV